MRRMRAYRNSRGLTLLECLAAVLILGLGMVGVIGSMTAALLSNQKASDMQLATAIAQGTVEQMRSLGFGEVDYESFPASCTKTTADPVTGETMDALAALRSATKTTVITSNYTGNAKLKKASVKVTWVGRNGQSNSVTLETLITNRQGLTGT